ncbi:WD repeat-containing protein 74 [Kappamyces sp. JEL0680]|nr:WD repeat-containing protein 74 [Kappamyces sp. JEL0680]
MKVHPSFPHIFATGGDERELCIWDITKRNQEDNSIEPIWKAKNVPHDYLDMRVPVWVSCIVWLSSDNHHDIAIGTGYHQIRVYNTAKQKRPQLDFTCGTHPVKTLIKTRNNEFVFSDTLGNVSAIDASTGQLVGRYRGIAGAVTDLYSCTLSPYLVTVSMDRKLRVFEEKGQRRLVKQVYLKQHLSTLLVAEEEETVPDPDDDVWDRLEEQVIPDEGAELEAAPKKRKQSSNK